MPNENQDPNQFINFIKEYKWRIIGFIAMLILAVLFLTIGFENSFNPSPMFNRCRIGVY